MKLLTFLLGVAATFTALAVARAPVIKAAGRSQDVVADRYMVVYKQDADLSLRDSHESVVNRKAAKSGRAGVIHRYSLQGFNGYSVEIGPDHMPYVLESELVSYVETVVLVSIGPVGEPQPIVVEMTEPEKKRSKDKRDVRSSYAWNWGDSRISHRSRTSDPAGSAYVSDMSAGLGAWAYVVDTGVLVEHSEFGGRAEFGQNLVNGSKNTDENGHGTHVAGTIIGNMVGVSRAAKVVAVKVLNAHGVGSSDTVTAGIHWAAQDALSRNIAPVTVINLSIGGAFSQSQNGLITAITTSLDIAVVAAAGNSNVDASRTSPASAFGALTVGAIDHADHRAAFSNYGKVVSVWAPGTDILSAWASCPSCYVNMNGTSMAAPHVSGLVAYFMAMDGLRGRTAVAERLLRVATRDVVAGVGVGAAGNALVYNGSGM